MRLTLAKGLATWYFLLKVYVETGLQRLPLSNFLITPCLLILAWISFISLSATLIFNDRSLLKRSQQKTSEKNDWFFNLPIHAQGSELWWVWNTVQWKRTEIVVDAHCAVVLLLMPQKCHFLIYLWLLSTCQMQRNKNWVVWRASKTWYFAFLDSAIFTFQIRLTRLKMIPVVKS